MDVSEILRVSMWRGYQSVTSWGNTQMRWKESRLNFFDGRVFMWMESRFRRRFEGLFFEKTTRFQLFLSLLIATFLASCLIGCGDRTNLDSKAKIQRGPEVSSDETGAKPSAAKSPKDGLIRTVEDWKTLGRTEPVRHIVCSGSGALRLVTYMGVADRVVAVERIEQQASTVAPYRLAHPEYGKLPIFGEGHGRDNVEQLLSLDPKPDVIFRIDNPGSGMDPVVLQERTGIPVVLISYGDLGAARSQLDGSLRLIGEVLQVQERAESVIAFFDSEIMELQKRVENLPSQSSPVVYFGGLSYRGVHGFCSTAPGYPPFEWLRLESPASQLTSDVIHASHAMISAEQIVAWNPDILFVDLGTLDMPGSGALSELKTQPLYRSMDAVRNGRLFALYPNQGYNTNFSAELANAWYIGSVAYPQPFADVDIPAKIANIFRFFTGDTPLVNGPERLKSMVYRPISLSVISGDR